jgi:fumarate hydratase class I
VSADADFRYSDLLPLGADDTPYRLVTTEGVSTFEAVVDGQSRTFLQVDPGRSGG